MVKSRNRLSIWLIKKPIAGFVIITFFISYVIGIPFNMVTSSFLTNSGEVLYLVLPRLVTVYAPGLSAIIMALILSGRGGLSLLIKKLQPEVKHVLWWLFIPITASLFTLFAYYLGGQPSEHVLSQLANNWQILIFHFICQLLIVGIGEELGWRGWLLPRLLEKGSVVYAVISIILIWGLWHLPLLFRGYKVVLPWIIILISLSIIFTWLWYKVEGNIFVFAIAHASANAPVYFIENRLLNVPENYTFWNGWAILSCVYLLFALIITYWYLSKQSTLKNN